MHSLPYEPSYLNTFKYVRLYQQQSASTNQTRQPKPNLNQPRPIEIELWNDMWMYVFFWYKAIIIDEVSKCFNKIITNVFLILQSSIKWMF